MRLLADVLAILPKYDSDLPADVLKPPPDLGEEAKEPALKGGFVTRLTDGRRKMRASGIFFARSVSS
jgi:hypothetical protein